jgi:heme-degrading monooxygenase HmoA
MIVCLRNVGVPTAERARFLDWIDANRPVREANGILLEWVLEPPEGETVVVTAWPSHDVFEAWIRTPHRDRLTASEVHRAVDYTPLTRYDLVGGYTNAAALAAVTTTKARRRDEMGDA